MSKNNSIYLDYASTTPMDEIALQEFVDVSRNIIGNPSSRNHKFGWDAEEIVEKSRNQIASVVNANPEEIIFTSGATESANIAILGISRFYFEEGKKDHIITCLTEHKCVIEPHRILKSMGFNVTFIKPNKNGRIDLDKLKSLITDRTILVSIMHVNNETGVIQDIESIGKITRQAGVFFFCDCAQSFGKINIDVEKMNIDCASISSHKIYGPKGVGAIYCRKKPRLKIKPILFGGDQERGIRSGTISPALCASFAKASEIATKNMVAENERLEKFSQKLKQELLKIDQVFMNGDPDHKIPGINNFTFRFVEGESLIMSLSDFAISSGSACTSKSLEPSYVLKSMGLDEDMAHSSLRISFGRLTKESDVDRFISTAKTEVERLRNMSPLWEMHQSGMDINSIEWTDH